MHERIRRCSNLSLRVDLVEGAAVPATSVEAVPLVGARAMAVAASIEVTSAARCALAVLITELLAGKIVEAPNLEAAGRGALQRHMSVTAAHGPGRRRGLDPALVRPSETSTRLGVVAAFVASRGRFEVVHTSLEGFEPVGELCKGHTALNVGSQVAAGGQAEGIAALLNCASGGLVLKGELGSGRGDGNGGKEGKGTHVARSKAELTSDRESAATPKFTA